MKRYLFWRICFLLHNKLAYDDQSSSPYINGAYWPSTPRMARVWRTNPIPGVGRTSEFPARLYRRLRKNRKDILIATVLNEATQRHFGNTLVSGVWQALELVEDGYKVRTYQQGDRAYIVGVRGEIANLWR